MYQNLALDRFVHVYSVKEFWWFDFTPPVLPKNIFASGPPPIPEIAILIDLGALVGTNDAAFFELDTLKN